MARCGCTSVPATGLSVLDTDTINVSGAGTVGSPYEFDVTFDPDADNLLEVTASGLFVPGAEVGTYTPTWRSNGGSGSQPSGGVFDCRYMAVGKLGLLQFEMFFTSGSVGTFQYDWSLPPGWSVADFCIAPVYLVHANIGTVSAIARFSGTTFEIWLQSGTSNPDTITPLGASSPATFAAPSFIELSAVLLLA